MECMQVSGIFINSTLSWVFTTHGRMMEGEGQQWKLKLIYLGILIF
jgi:hypothetical protein